MVGEGKAEMTWFYHPSKQPRLIYKYKKFSSFTYYFCHIPWLVLFHAVHNATLSAIKNKIVFALTLERNTFVNSLLWMVSRMVSTSYLTHWKFDYLQHPDGSLQVAGATYGSHIFSVSRQCKSSSLRMFPTVRFSTVCLIVAWFEMA